jgi:hypothetical protein
VADYLVTLDYVDENRIGVLVFVVVVVIQLMLQ